MSIIFNISEGIVCLGVTWGVLACQITPTPSFLAPSTSFAQWARNIP